MNEGRIHPLSWPVFIERHGNEQELPGLPRERVRTLIAGFSVIAERGAERNAVQRAAAARPANLVRVVLNERFAVDTAVCFAHLRFRARGTIFPVFFPRILSTLEYCAAPFLMRVAARPMARPFAGFIERLRTQ